jgi:membrane-bound serine protease (ClpP class)
MLKRLYAIVLVCLGLVPTVLGAFAETPSPKAEPSAAPRPTPSWVTVDIGIIGPASEDVLSSAMKMVKERNAQGLVVRLDTPGGALDSTRNMVKEIMGASFPVVVWVGPAGSRAGSAGAFITLAAHVAAMAPGTNIGASHPVEGSGQDVPGKEMERKVTNDTVAFIESIAKERKRNVDMARSFVVTSVSITDGEALDHKVIDLLAKDVPELLDKIDQREVEVAPTAARDRVKVKIDSAHAQLLPYEKTLRQRLFEIVANPNVFYLLFMAGLLGLGYELTHPGVIFPGVAGGICLILALIAMSVLPVSYGAIALILVGIALLIGEAFMPSFGALGVGGLVAFVLGSLFLVDPRDESGLRVSWYTIAPTVLVVGGGFLALGFIVLRATRSPVKSGREGMIGESASVIDDFDGTRGQVRAAGGIWSARFVPQVEDERLRAGDDVRVVAIDGLVLTVEKTRRS